MLAKKTLKSGPGLPIVFLHGFLGRSEDWEKVCSFLPPVECIGFDLPGHGSSPFVEDFHIGISHFHLVGYSMGGRIAIGYALRHPEQIASLTVMSAHPGLNTEKERKERLKSDQAWAKLLLELPIEEFLLRWYEQPIFLPFKPDLTLRRHQNVHALKAALLHYSLGLQPKYQIEGVLIGERDEKFKALYERPIIIPDAGHMVHLENPKAVAEACLKVFSI